MKKKILAICLVAVMALTAIAGASLAYLTDTDKADNTFTLGNVKIDLHEGAYANVQKNGAPIDAEGELDMSKANPNEQTDDNFGYDYLDTTYDTWLAGQVLVPGTQEFNRIQKRVFVENTGKNDAYVRVILGVPAELDNKDDSAKNLLHWNQVTGDINNKLGNWVEDGEYAFTQDGYNYYIIYYTKALKAGEATNAEAISYFYLDEKVDFDGTNYFVMNGTTKVVLTSIVNGKINIPVYAEAIQAGGFDKYTDAFKAYGEPAFKK